MDLTKTFGLPVSLEGADYRLKFGEGIEPEDRSSKYLQQVIGLLYKPDAALGKDELSYSFCPGIYKEEHKTLFKSRDYANGITVLMPVTNDATGGECRKNSGHYHGITEGHTLPYPEAYEILTGKAVFLLQKSTNFHIDEEVAVDEMFAVFLEPGEKLIVPPYYAHCAINIGEGPMAFGNLAAPSPLFYEPIQKKHGFGYYVLKINGHVVFVPNARYRNLPQLKIAKAQENKDMGISFDTPLYTSFINEPERFDYLSNPEKYELQIDALLLK